MFLHELDLRSSLDNVPFLGFSQHPAPQGAECVVVIAWTAREGQPASIGFGDRIKPFRARTSTILKLGVSRLVMWRRCGRHAAEVS